MSRRPSGRTLPMPKRDHRSFYQMLGVRPDAAPAEIRAAFLRLAQQCHPDLNRDDHTADRHFKRIRHVYEVLRDPLKRAAYDEDPARHELVEMPGGDTESSNTAGGRVGPSWPPGDSPTFGDRAFLPRWNFPAPNPRTNRPVFVAVSLAVVAMAAVPFVLSQMTRPPTVSAHLTFHSHPDPAATHPTASVPSRAGGAENVAFQRHADEREAGETQAVARDATDPAPVQRVLISAQKLRAEPTPPGHWQPTEPSPLGGHFEFLEQLEWSTERWPMPPRVLPPTAQAPLPALPGGDLDSEILSRNSFPAAFASPSAWESTTPGRVTPTGFWELALTAKPIPPGLGPMPGPVAFAHSPFPVQQNPPWQDAPRERLPSSPHGPYGIREAAGRGAFEPISGLAPTPWGPVHRSALAAPPSSAPSWVSDAPSAFAAPATVSLPTLPMSRDGTSVIGAAAWTGPTPFPASGAPSWQSSNGTNRERGIVRGSAFSAGSLVPSWPGPAPGFQRGSGPSMGSATLPPLRTWDEEPP